MEQSEYDLIYGYIREGKFPNTFTKNKKDSLRRKSKHFVVKEFNKFTAELHPIPVRDEVWHTIGVDLIGPLPETPRGNKYIMTVSYFFSKWPEATALEDKSAIGVFVQMFYKA